MNGTSIRRCVRTANWQAILQGITNNLASYNPIYVTLDYASQYVRATRTSRLLSSGYDPVSGQVTAHLVREDGSGHFGLCLCRRRQFHQFQFRHRAGLLGDCHRHGGDRAGGAPGGAGGHQRASQPD